MSKKKIITTKDLAHSLGNKTPVQVVTAMASKKHGHYKLNGTKEQKKIAKSACQHHIVDKHGRLKPMLEYGNENKVVRCMLCGATFPTSFYEDGFVHKNTSQLKTIRAQAKMMAWAIGADKETSMYLTGTNMNLDQFPKVYRSLRSVAEKADRSKKKKKNKKRKQEIGGWYQN